MTLFVDLDGVMADFDRGYLDLFGEPVNRAGGDRRDMWQKIQEHGSFFETLHPMRDMHMLWEHCMEYKPTILTGCPKEMPESADQKRRWVDKHLGKSVKMIAIQSKRKSDHCKLNDIIIDDWGKYRHLWVAKGGHWILHETAKKSIMELEHTMWNVIK